MVQLWVIAEAILKRTNTELAIGEDYAGIRGLVGEKMGQTHTDGPGFAEVISPVADTRVEVNVWKAEVSWVLNEAPSTGRTRVGDGRAICVNDRGLSGNFRYNAMGVLIG